MLVAQQDDDDDDKSYIYMYKEDLTLNIVQWLICHKTQPN